MSVTSEESCRRAQDGLPARVVRYWAKEKLHYFKRFIDIFTTSMRRKWKERVYVDLFAGPGRCILDPGQEEIDGSPLVALTVKHPFSKYVFVEKNRSLADALGQRVDGLGLDIKPKYYVGDCNSLIPEIRKELPPDALSFVFIDPTGLQINWDSVVELVTDRRVDILFTFMYHQGIKRNITGSLELTDTRMDRFLPPGFDWKGYHKKCGMKPSDTAMAILDHYIASLNKLGYREISVEDDLISVSSSGRRYLYFLLFASKHPLGMKFWREDIKKPFSQYRLL